MVKKYILLCFISLLTINVLAQVNDSFDDGDFTDNPSWSGDINDWQVINGQLNSKAPAVSGISQLVTPSTVYSGCQWSFFANPNFQVSSASYIDVFLTSDSANLKGNNSGYFVRIGRTTHDVSLYKKVAGISDVIISGAPNTISSSSNNPTKVKVIRDTSFNWTLSIDVSGTGNSYVVQGSATDSTLKASNYFGVLIKYAASYSTKFYFDDFYAGPIIIDNSPPDISKVSVISGNQLDVLFTEPVESVSAQTLKNYSANKGIGMVSNAVKDFSNPSLIHLFFANSFQSGNDYELTVDSIRDLSGNLLIHKAINFSYYLPQKNDVAINEIMANPAPPVALPNVEWVELYNTSSFPIDLNGWSFSDAAATQSLSAYILQPDSFLILCSSVNKDQLVLYGNVMGLASFPSLNNSSDSLKLKDSKGRIISIVNYSDTWYKDAVKKNGGWSLELIDPYHPCGEADNWTASVDLSGGTPGKRNSVYGANPDTQTPSLLQALVIDSSTIQLVFSERMDSTLAVTVTNYSISPGIGTPAGASIDGSGIYVTLLLPVQIQKNKVYDVTVNNVADCSGNLMGANNLAQFAIPEKIDSFDLIINEVLFNPVTYGYDYLELYNRSQKIVNLKDLYVANRNDSAVLSSIKQVSTGYLFFPGDYVVLTQNPDWVQQNYLVKNPKALIKLSSLPTMPDDKGDILIFSGSQKIIDELKYNQSWHSPLLDDKNGVSLERISFDSPTQDSSNWHSAATTSGYGTPTYLNSQYRDITETTDEILVEPQVFSPDQDGYNDFAVIQYKFSQPGFIGNFRIYDKEGRIIRELVRNELLSQSGFFTWDGTTDEGSRAKVGIYIVYAEVFDSSGDIKKFRKTCVVAGKQH